MAKSQLPAELRTFGKIFDSIARRHGSYHVFQDFLDLSINAWSHNHAIDLPAIRKRYDEKERHEFGKLIQETILVLDKMITDDSAFYDVFGTFYEVNSLTNKHFAQFFTPLHVCLFMAKIVAPNPKDNFSDPCSGSGRFSLAANSVSPGMFHSLIDIDYTCAKMSALNLMYHGIRGIVICDNGLFAGKSFRGAFVVNRKLMFQRVPEIEFLDSAEQAYNYVSLHLPKAKEQPEEKQSIQDVADVIMDSKTGQTRLF